MFIEIPKGIYHCEQIILHSHCLKAAYKMFRVKKHIWKKLEKVKGLTERFLRAEIMCYLYHICYISLTQWADHSTYLNID